MKLEWIQSISEAFLLTALVIEACVGIGALAARLYNREVSPYVADLKP